MEDKILTLPAVGEDRIDFPHFPIYNEEKRLP